MRDATCWKCGYDLAGLQDGGRCPECNAVARECRNPPTNAAFATGSLVLGIISMLAVVPYPFCIFSAPFALLTAVPGVILGHLAMNRSLHAGQGLAVVGLVFSHLALQVALLIAGMYVVIALISAVYSAPIPPAPAPAGP